jgi:hypothetical protein
LGSFLVIDGDEYVIVEFAGYQLEWNHIQFNIELCCFQVGCKRLSFWWSNYDSIEFKICLANISNKIVVSCYSNLLYDSTPDAKSPIVLRDVLGVELFKEEDYRDGIIGMLDDRWDEAFIQELFKVDWFHYPLFIESSTEVVELSLPELSLGAVLIGIIHIEYPG